MVAVTVQSHDMRHVHNSVACWSGKQLPALWQGAVSKILNQRSVQNRLGSHCQQSSYNDAISPNVRSFASTSQGGNESGGNQGKSREKTGQPKVGPGFFETFRKSVMDQFSRKSAEDTKVKEAMERLQQARVEAEDAARRSMDIAQKAAEEAKKQAEKVEEQTRPTREKIGGGGGGGGATPQVREALGDDPTTTGPVAGKAIDTESLGVMVRHPAISAVPPPRAARAAVVAAPVSGAPVRGPPPPLRHHALFRSGSSGPALSVRLFRSGSSGPARVRAKRGPRPSARARCSWPVREGPRRSLRTGRSGAIAVRYAAPAPA